MVEKVRAKKASFTCYHSGCAGVKLKAILGKEVTSEIYPGFIGMGKVGRIRWDPTKPMKCFRIDAPYGTSRCPKCDSVFVEVLIASKDGKEVRFGYESE